ncbi:MAG TPA: SDR family oxidoreductase [Nevskiaceae bacterium]|nr:SDR family oxidoreductase [Nevskiaceae bacterium]
MADAKRVVLVTGGTKGVGRGIAETFLSNGDTVVVCGRHAPEAAPEAAGRRAEFLACDVREVAQLDELLATIQQRHGHLDVLVNNAGGAPFALAADASPRFHEKIIALNLLAPLHLSQKANAIMQKQPSGGAIVFIASVSAIRPSPGTAAYGAAKAGLVNLAASLAVEWAPKVRINALTLGLVKTESAALHYGDEAGIAAVAATIPLGRMALPADAGAACLWLASAGASYMSGSNLVIHGGGERPAFLSAANAAHSE